MGSLVIRPIYSLELGEISSNNLSIDEIQKHSKISIENIEKLLKFQDQKHIKSNHMREMPHGWLPDF